MARLPQPGSDEGTWGQILNDFLSVSLQTDGSLKQDVVDGGALQDGTITAAKLTAGTGTGGQLLMRDTGVPGGLSWATPTAPPLEDGSVTADIIYAGVGQDGNMLTLDTGSPSGLSWAEVEVPPDASSSTKGLVRLTGDLGGTADSPTVPGLAGKASTTVTDALDARIDTLESYGLAALTDAATIATDASLGRHFRVTVSGDRTLGAPTNAADGMRVMWEITAASADRSITLATGTAGSFELTVGIASPVTITSGKTLFLGAVYNAARNRWSVIASRALA
ncbi:hypothetical protein JNJ66_02510 [Candidatus Saccharibacteria bacterium]|nr:hypothetical protein [Candidatus Saccharibacteria bacterium]